MWKNEAHRRGSSRLELRYNRRKIVAVRAQAVQPDHDVIGFGSGFGHYTIERFAHEFSHASDSTNTCASTVTFRPPQDRENRSTRTFSGSRPEALEAALSQDFQLLPSEDRQMITTRLPRPALPLLALALILSLATLAGCGLKGDLYLPEPGQEATSDSPLPDDEESSP